MRPLLLALLFTSILSGAAAAETHVVKMLNGNHTGGMAFEPDYLRVQPGDTVKFLATQRGHNAATIDGFLPEGAEPFKGRINEEIEVAFTEEGFYGVKCTPHYDMGMVILIQVGDAPLADAVLPAGMPRGSTQRFEAIIERTMAAGAH